MTPDHRWNYRVAIFTAGLACAIAVVAAALHCWQTAQRSVPATLRAIAVVEARPADSAAQDANRWVGDAKESLKDSGNRPWYDPETDDVAVPQFQPERHPFQLPDFLLTLLQWSAWTLIGAVIAGLVWLLIRAYLARETAQAAPQAAGPTQLTMADRVEALPFALQRSHDDLLGAARKHFEAGNYSEAIIYLFSHQLVELDRAQCIRLAKGKTNRQYIKELADRADLRGLLAETMDRFELVFFGAHPLDRAAFEACWQRLPQFQQLLAGSGT